MAGCATENASDYKAEQFLCIASTVVWTTTSEDGKTTSGHNYDEADSKYLFSNSGGTWQAMGMGASAWHFDHCDPPGLVCEVDGPDHEHPDTIFEGAISRNPRNGAFYATGVQGNALSSHVFAVAGTCSRYLKPF